MKKVAKEVIGWREWIQLPELKVKRIKAKVDTGARTSSLHAFDLTYFRKSGREYVKFKIKPDQRSSKTYVNCTAKVIEQRRIKSSNGQTELRPVILTPIRMMGQEWPIEITLTNRDEMGFRMLLGRECFKSRFIVDAGSSFFGEKKVKKEKLK